jgi:hypothetical protein
MPNVAKGHLKLRHTKDKHGFAYIMKYKGKESHAKKLERGTTPKDRRLKITWDPDADMISGKPGKGVKPKGPNIDKKFTNPYDESWPTIDTQVSIYFLPLSEGGGFEIPNISSYVGMEPGQLSDDDEDAPKPTQLDRIESMVRELYEALNG